MGVCGAKWSKNALAYEELRDLAAKGMTGPQLATHFGIGVEAIRKRALRLGIKIAPTVQKLASHPSWKGGIVHDRCGYRLTRVACDGPYGYLIRTGRTRQNGAVDTHGYAAEHRIVMHNTLGRRLLPAEVVDHIDGNKQNNAP